MATAHILPLADLVAHEDDVCCICGPDVEYMIGPEGAFAKLIVHHSLDGRELHEQRQT